ncbi:MAG: hypothetical protein KIT09_13690 [Bryobacteraceae bacterium]|nr:hypothetical protein [Bryobacteraceae bacterium]
MGTIGLRAAEPAMLPNFVQPEAVQRADGESVAVELGEAKGKLIHLTLGITRIIEQESLDVSIWASPDGVAWSEKPIVAFPQKFYCGDYTLLLDLTNHPDAAFLKARWKMSRWGRGEPKPLFAFYVFAQEAGSELVSTAGTS